MGDVIGDITNPFGVFGDEPSAPNAPNVNNTIRQQEQFNRLFQFTPNGNIEYGTIGDDGQFVAREGAQAIRQTESPFQEQFRTGREELALGLLGNIARPENFQDFRSARDIESNLQTPLLGDFADDASRIEQETFEAGQRRLDPIVQQEREDLVQNLADRGIPLSSEAGQKELNRFDQSVGDRRQDLAFGAIDAGRVEQDRLSKLTAALRGQEVNEQLSLANLEQQQRAQQFGELGALSGFSAPFQPLNAPSIDVAGIINQGYANQLGQANFQQGQFDQRRSFVGDMAQTGATAFALSDKNLKENISYHSTKNGYKLYDFNYKGDSVRYRGVMAQDVKKIKPEAVVTMDNGYMGVIYDMLGLKMEVVT